MHHEWMEENIPGGGLTSPKQLRTSLLALLSEGVNAARLMSVLSAFAFTIFCLVDPYLVTDGLTTIRLIRALLVVSNGVVFWLTFTSWGNRHFINLGTTVTVLTGLGVIVLTHLTGGPSSPYWTMLMLTFFGATLILPQRMGRALITYSALTVTYLLLVWNTSNPEELSHSQVSLAGIMLSLIVSVAATAYLDEYRRRGERVRVELLALNERLTHEIAIREQAESNLRRTQQLDAVGRLGAGLAHELNNLLAVILASAESIRADPDRSSRSADRIIKSAKSSAQLTNDLLTFARKRVHNTAPFVLNELVVQIAEVVSRSYPRRIDVQMSGFDTKVWMKGDQQLLEQAFLNLCLNGVHAIDSQGVLQIRGRRIDDQSVEVTIEDDGCGMSETVMNQAIEPFFTTRPPGQGTGLGLSMAYGTIQEHGGTLEIESVEGQGTIIRIVLPTMSRQVLSTVPGAVNAPQVEEVPIIGDKSTSLGHILVVEDDKTLSLVMAEWLESSGWIVTQVESGEDALSLIELKEAEISAIILDRMMPGMSGDETYRLLRARGSNIPILLYSGLVMDPDVAALLQDGPGRFIQKPFSRAEFETVLRDVMDTCSS